MCRNNCSIGFSHGEYYAFINKVALNYIMVSFTEECLCMVALSISTTICLCLVAGSVLSFLRQ